MIDLADRLPLWWGAFVCESVVVCSCCVCKVGHCISLTFQSDVHLVLISQGSTFWNCARLFWHMAIKIQLRSTVSDWIRQEFGSVRIYEAIRHPWLVPRRSCLCEIGDHPILCFKWRPNQDPDHGLFFERFDDKFGVEFAVWRNLG